MSDTLVIDVSGMPVEFVNWQRAVTLFYNQRVRVLHSDPERILRSANKNFELEMPRVVQLKNKVTKRMHRKVPLTRRHVAIRDNSTCQYCGDVLETSEYTLDHIVPRALGGTTIWTNVVLACVPCNKEKGCRPLKATDLRLRSTPKEPSIWDKRFNFKLHIKRLRPEWQPWSTWIYWNVELEK
jgi:5-methylcytosine-specific restriction endonuclease McrA